MVVYRAGVADYAHGMKLLVLGGTVFLGLHVAEAALAAGCEVTLLNRGNRTVEFTVPVEHLRGDRNGDLGALHGRRFDAVVDCSGYTPSQLQCAADVLRDHVDHYVFVSTVSVYARFPPGQAYDESAALTASEEGYGGGKAGAEAVILRAMPARVTVVRPGLIVGPHDPTGRFTYWPLRLARGGTVLAPGRPDRPVQLIDARDLAAWCVELALQRRAGVMHGVGPSGTMAGLLEACAHAAGRRASLVWCSDQTLLGAQIAPWSGLPLWIPEADPHFGGMLLASDQHAVQAGLRTRPWSETARDTLAWARAAGDAALSTTTLAAEAEATLLASLR